MKDALVTVFQRPEDFVLSPSGRTKFGLRVPIEPVLVIPLNDVAEFQSKLEASFSVSAETEAPEPDWTSFRSPTFAAVGVKNERQFFKGVRTVTAHRHPQRGFVISPMKLSGRHNLVPDDESVVTLGDTGMKRVVETIFELLMIAERHP